MIKTFLVWLIHANSSLRISNHTCWLVLVCWLSITSGKFDLVYYNLIAYFLISAKQEEISHNHIQSASFVIH